MVQFFRLGTLPPSPLPGMDASVRAINSLFFLFFFTSSMLSISLDRESYAPGDTITATISVRQEKPLEARSLSAMLTCTKREKVKTQVVLDRYDYDRDKEMSIPYSSHMETKTEQRQHVAFEQEKEISGKRTFLGEENFTVQFTLPAKAAPTDREFGHDNTIISWKIKAKLDIPYAFDENVEAEVRVEGL